VESLLFLMPLIPFLGFLILAVGGKSIKEPSSGYLAALMVLVSFVLAVFGFIETLGLEEGKYIHQVLWDWLPGMSEGGKALTLGLALDQLSSVMTLIITGIGFLIHVFAIGYMHGDAGFTRFFSYLNLFIAAMLVLVLGDSYPLVFVGWEGVGVASYLLLGFWYRAFNNPDAARKAFITNRVGDVFFILAMGMMFTTFGTLNIHDMHESAKGFAFNVPAVELICVFLLLGAAGKSAQLPLSTWLPDAMAGPTPVSALIHAATMVTAGVYLVARSNFLYSIAPDASTWVMVVGALTALYGALSAIAQTDIKKILAYSTVSQLGLMFVAVGAGAYWAGIFHVMTHAFFKALLFLASGSVIHGMDGEQDVRKMGGLKAMMPTTHTVSLIGVLAIGGAPLLSGFWSKDAILTSAFSSPFGGGLNIVLWVVSLAVAVLTAFYMYRWYHLVFLGEYRGPKNHHPHESPAIMTMPLWVLAVLSLFGGFLGLPHFLGEKVNLLEHYLEPVAHNAEDFAKLSLLSELILIALAISAAVAGWVLARTWFRRDGVLGVAEVPNRFGEISRGALFVDWLYQTTIGTPSRYVADTLAQGDEQVVDGAANGVAAIAKGTGTALREWESGFVRAYAVAILLGTAILLGFIMLRGGL
jgi:NADH-quinone oxidoreductase subunit L